MSNLNNTFRDENCIDTLIKIKWNKAKTCPKCNSKTKFYRINNQLKCSKCRKFFSVRNGTLFEKSKLPLKTWFRAFEYICETKSFNSTKLASEIGVTQKTAYYMIKKIKTRNIINFNLLKQIEKQIKELDREYIRTLLLKPEGYNENLKRIRLHKKKIKTPFMISLETAINYGCL